ncbi:hypothetical protein BsWGS_19910 [Bradybaena similaris]
MANYENKLEMSYSGASNNETDMTNLAYNLSADKVYCCLVNSDEASSETKNLVVPAVMFFLGVLGNVAALVILTVRPSKDSKSTAFYHLVKALACMDLFGIVASSPVTIVVYLKGGIFNTGGPPLCHYFSFILVMAGNATLFTVLVMAAERFLVTKYPFKYSEVVTPKAVNICILLLWGLSTLIAILPIVGVGGNIAPWPGTWCFFDYRSTSSGGQAFSYFYAITGLLAIIITMVLNLIVIQHLWRMRRSRLVHSSFHSSQDSGDSHNGGRGPDSEMRMVVLLMAIIVVFTVCYAPLMVRIIINQLWNVQPVKVPGGVDDALDLWALRLACVNQILDPWVYIISRVTCCDGSRRRDSYSRKHSAPKYHAIHTNSISAGQPHSSPHHGITAM